MNRRTFVLGATLFAAALLFAGCGDDNDSPGNGNGSAPRRGGEITVQHRAFGSFDPHFTAFGRDISQLGMVFRGLYKLDENDELVPELAAGLPSISADGKTYTIEIKPDLLWSDGEPLTVDDFVAGFQRTCNPDVGGRYSGSLFNIVGCLAYRTADPGSSDADKQALLDALGVRATDDKTIEITLERPQASFAPQLALWFSWPVPTHIVTSPGAEWPTDPTQLVFNGPFKVESYTAEQQLVLVRNDNYGGEQPAHLDKITLRYIESLETANNAFRSGEIDHSQANPAALDVLRADSAIAELLHGQEKSGNTLALTMNAASEPLSNQHLRRALSQATDRAALVRVVFKDAHIPTTSWIPESLIGLDADPFRDSIGYDPEAAKESFEESGVGTDVDLTLAIIDSPEYRDAAAFLKEQWKQILGIDITVQVADAATVQGSFQDQSYQLIFLGWTQDYPDPENWVDGLFQTGAPNNQFGCSSEELDSLLEDAKVNLDADERREQYVKINRIISEELCGVAPLYHQRTFYLTAEKLKGPREYSTSQNRFLAGDWAVEKWYLEE